MKKNFILHFFTNGLSYEIDHAVQCSGSLLFSKSITNTNQLILRTIFAWYTTAIIIWAYLFHIYSGDGPYIFFTYVTNWSLVINTAYFWVVIILHVSVQKIFRNLDEKTLETNNYKYSIIEQNNLKHLWTLAIVCLNMSVSISAVVILFYWSLSRAYYPMTPKSVHTHGVAGAMLLFDWFSSCWQLNFRCLIFPLVVAILWVFMSIGFHFAGWINPQGERYIYPMILWGQNPIQATGVCTFMCLLLIVLHIVLIKLKYYIFKYWINKKLIHFDTKVRFFYRFNDEMEKINIEKSLKNMSNVETSNNTFNNNTNNKNTTSINDIKINVDGNFTRIVSNTPSPLPAPAAQVYTLSATSTVSQSEFMRRNSTLETDIGAEYEKTKAIEIHGSD